MDASTQPVDKARLEAEIRSVGRELVDGLPSAARHPLRSVDERAMRISTDDAELRAALFRLVDVTPACHSLDDLAEHLRAFGGEIDDPPAPLEMAMKAGHTKAGRMALGAAVAAGVRHMAHRFIAGESPEEALGELRRLWDAGVASTVDLLGEATLTREESDGYAGRCEEALRTLVEAQSRLPDRPVLDRDPAGDLPRANLSVKVTALTPLIRPEAPRRGREDAARRLRPLLVTARDVGAHLHIDMESLDTRETTLELLFELLADDEFREGPSVGVVLQAYLRDSADELEQILAGVGAGRRRSPLTIRLVKGAYWDHEVVEARQRGWTPPVFEEKPESDRNFEALSRRLLDESRARPELIRVAIGSHNLRSVAHAIAYNRLAGGTDSGVELQVLRGLGDDLAHAIAGLGLRARSYCPVGDLVAGMAYLVRRLLENTANESFLGQQARGASLEELLGGPLTIEADLGAPFRNEPLLELRRASERAALAGALAELDRRLPIAVPVWIGSERREDAEFVSSDPGRPDRVVATAAEATRADVEAAVDAADQAGREWSGRPAEERARALLDAAEGLRRRRLDLAALEVRECAKPWAEADADVCEAIDYLVYYAREALRLAPGPALEQAPGERNTMRYVARGVAAVISPWNFPLAIPAGMTAAALAAGNAVLLKPAEQAPATALALVETLRAAGVPPGALSLLPGHGPVGAALVRDPRVHVIAFTGSSTVGLEIVQTAAETPPGQGHVKRVIAEMGGKNCAIVDADADLDDAVPAIIASAFAYAGQKCSAISRVLAHEVIHDSLAKRLAGAVELLRVGPAEELETEVPPVIESEARDRVTRYQELADVDGRIIARAGAPAGPGWFCPPTLAAVLEQSSAVLREEVFGPLLTIEPVPSVDAACDIVDGLQFALTGALFSRNPATVEAVAARSPVGNLYVNRRATGAMVGRQPFGGNRLSGVGSKAGGPDYLLQFTDPRVVAENTTRHGLVVE